MRLTSRVHNLSLFTWLTFVSAYGLQVHALSTSEQALTTDILFDALSLTKTTLAEIEEIPIVSASGMTASSPTADSTASVSVSVSESAAPAPAPEALVSASAASSSVPVSAGIENGFQVIVPSSASLTAISGSSLTLGSTAALTSLAPVTPPSIYDSKTSITMTTNANSIGTTSTRSILNAFASDTKTRSNISSKYTIPVATSRTVKSSRRTPFDFKSNGRSDSSSGTFATAAGDRQRTFRNQHHHERHWGPFFEESHNSTLSGDNLVSTAHLFTEAVLNCRVGMLKDKIVMWVRKESDKVSLLTVGNVTYSGDPRIHVKFQYPNNWRLLINPTQKEDAGVYMCQVSTHPPRVSITNLTILEPPLRLIDDQDRDVGDRYYKAGSTIDLQCQVSRSFLAKEKTSILKSLQMPTTMLSPNLFLATSASPLDFTNNNQWKLNTNKGNIAGNTFGLAANELVINENTINNNNESSTKPIQSLEKQFNSVVFWYKDDVPLPATATKRFSTSEKWLNSRVSIPDANLLDSGNYSCSIGKVFTAIVQVQVLSGELPAAVQHNPSTSIHLPNYLLLNVCVGLCSFILWSLYPATHPSPFF